MFLCCGHVFHFVRTRVGRPRRLNGPKATLRCFPIYSQTNSSRLHRRGLLQPRPCCHTRTATAAMQRHAALRPSATACFSVASSPLTTCRRVLRANASLPMATAPARRSSPRPVACLLPASLTIAPERRSLVTAVPHQVGHGCQRRHVFCFRCVSEVVSKCFICMLRWLYTYVASVCFKCFSCFIRMFHAFHLYVLCVSSVCFMCFILMLQKDLSCICCNSYTCMFQVYVPYVSSVLDVCCKCMFQIFQLFQTHILCVSSRCVQ
jgi:hypothetical protein